IMTGSGSQASQTPSATATLSSSGNMALPGTLSLGSSPPTFTVGTGMVFFGLEGTEPTGVSSGASGFVADSTLHCPVDWSNGIQVGCVIAAKEAAISFSATPIFNAVASSNIITLTANVTSSTLAAGYSGQPMSMIICQNGTGGFTFVWPTNM